MSTRPEPTYDDATTPSTRTDPTTDRSTTDDFSPPATEDSRATDDALTPYDGASWTDRCTRQFDATDAGRMRNLADDENHAMHDGV